MGLTVVVCVSAMLSHKKRSSNRGIIRVSVHVWVHYGHTQTVYRLDTDTDTATHAGIQMCSQQQKTLTYTLVAAAGHKRASLYIDNSSALFMSSSTGIGLVDLVVLTRVCFPASRLSEEGGHQGIL